MDKLTFYFDRCFGRRFPEALKHAIPPFEVEFHHSAKSHFAATTPDDEWLSIVGQQGWVVFSHDRRFHKDILAASAIKQHSIGCFYLWGAEASTWDKLSFFVRNAEKIIDTANDARRPFIFHVAKSGHFSKVDIP